MRIAASASPGKWGSLAVFPRLMAATVLLVCLTSTSSATIVAFDGFGDADRNNDGATDGAAVTDATDVGLQWYSIDTATSLPKPTLTVASDAAGIGSGNALFAESRATNSEAIGRFASAISLGSQTGDKLIMSFDFRVNPSAHPVSGLGTASFRFGLYQDTDSQLGTSGWGTSDGKFDNASPGAVGDTGFHLRLALGNAPGTVAGSDTRVRIAEENVTSGLSIFGTSGTSFDSIGQPSGTFPVIGDALEHRITFTLERTGAGPNDYIATLALDGNSFTGIEGVTDTVASVFNFHYFAMQNQTVDFDYIVDNFQIETVAIPEPNALVFLALSGMLMTSVWCVRQLALGSLRRYFFLSNG